MAKDSPTAGEPGGPEPDLDLLGVLARVSQLSSALSRGKLIERATAAAGMTIDRPSITVLVTLQMAGEPLRIGEIATRMQVVGPHVTRQLNELERRDLARRVPDPHDQRARLIELTPAGATAATRYMTTLLGWFGDVLNDWSPQDRQTFGHLLERFATDLTARAETLDGP